MNAENLYRQIKEGRSGTAEDISAEALLEYSNIAKVRDSIMSTIPFQRHTIGEMVVTSCRVNAILAENMKNSAIQLRDLLVCLKNKNSHEVFVYVLREVSFRLIAICAMMDSYLSSELPRSSETEKDRLIRNIAEAIILLTIHNDISKDLARIFCEEIVMACPEIRCHFDTSRGDINKLAILKLYFFIIKYRSEMPSCDRNDLLFSVGDLWQWMANMSNILDADTATNEFNVIVSLDMFIDDCSEVLFNTYEKQFTKALTILKEGICRIKKRLTNLEFLAPNIENLKSKMDFCIEQSQGCP
ncbi:hypothetical protein ACOME3_004387 [Neoechinorhynchus agilis]